MSQPRDDRQDDLFRPLLEEIINLRHPLVRLAGEIDWDFLAGRFSSVCRVGPGQPPLPTRLVAGLFILKHMHNLSDEALCERWVENPYFQYFCGEVVFRHELPFDRSSLTRWRQRLGEEQIVALLQESLSVAHRTGAIDTKDLERVAIDTTVQEKAIAHPTDARLTHRAIEKLVELAKREGVALRQSYLRLAKRAAIMVGRYTHAHQFKRARRELKFLRTRLGRIIRDIRRKIEGNTALEDRFGPLLDLALRVRHQEQRQRGPKVYSLHAPEVECIGRGKARAPYEFGCKVSIATPVTAPKGGQFVLHAKALHGNPYDGHTLGPVIADLEKLTGGTVRRIHGDKGYRGHNYPNRFKVWISGQVRRVTKAIRREMRRRAAIEPVIGHLKEDHRMGRNYLTGRPGDRINAVLAAAGYNFSLLLRWFDELLRVLSLILCHALLADPLHLIITRCRKKLSSRPTTWPDRMMSQGCHKRTDGPRQKKCMVILFDHSVSARQYCVGDRDAKCFCRSQINRQLDLRGLLDRKISRFRAGQYLLHVFSSAMIHGAPWRPITHQGASICKLRNVCDGGESVLECQHGNGLTQVIEGGVGHDDQGLRRLARKSHKGGTEFARGRELDQPNRHTH
jgi:IS5 family transposase